MAIMKQFRLTVRHLNGNEVVRMITRRDLESAMVAAAGFVGAFCSDEIVRRVTVEEIRPIARTAQLPVPRWNALPNWAEDAIAAR